MQEAAQAPDCSIERRHAEDHRLVLETKISVQKTVLPLPDERAQTHLAPRAAHQARILPLLAINPITDPQLAFTQVKHNNLLPPPTHQDHPRAEQVHIVFIEFLLKKMPQTNPNHLRQYCATRGGHQVQHPHRPV